MKLLITKILRFTLCLLLAGLMQATPLLQGASEEAAEPQYPADALRHLSTANVYDVVTGPVGRHYSLSHGLKTYSELIHKYADPAGMDWSLLAAVIFQESQFNELAESNRSAKGLMQLRDVVAEQYDMLDADLFDPETNVALGTRLFRDLMRGFEKEGLDSVNVVRFALASYNSGGGTLAKKRQEALDSGLDPNDWNCVAEVYSRTSTITPAYVEAVEETVIAYREAGK
ncbi:MAG: transglycosylase SLT domain-containing protein [Bacteroidales bacterium]|nr:transglycosylase SLT domain-containing protein [Bacteroidales bacterium]